MSAPAAAAISQATTMGAVHLTAGDLGRSVAFYAEAVGLEQLSRDAGEAVLGVSGAPLVVLFEQPGALPAPGSTGLFHLALRVPDRVSLARWLAHAGRAQVQLDGLSDHFVSEAIYLHDPDEHGIEIYADRPRELWEGQVDRLTTLPLDIQGLLSDLGDSASASFDGLPEGTDMGHVHLQVSSLPESVAFYRDVLGFELMASYGDQAAFLAAGGYHHHVGVNTWRSLGAAAPPPRAAALRYATIVLPDPDERDRVAARAAAAEAPTEAHPDGVLVRDPSGIALLLTA